MNQLLLVSIFLPVAAAALVFILPRGWNRAREVIVMAAASANLYTAWSIFEKNLSIELPWIPAVTGFTLRAYSFGGFILMSAAAFSFLAFLYSCVFMRGRDLLKQYYGYLLLAVSFINGVALADNLLVLLFFWEGMLVLLFGLIRLGGRGSYQTAIKAFIIQGGADLCMMAGIAITAWLAGTFAMSGIKVTAQGPMGILAWTLLAAGAIAKAGGMPFHSWIPDAAVDAPLGFMAMQAVCLDKLAGIYLLVRVSVDLFHLKAGSGMSLMLMTIGAFTIIAAVMMALVQKNYKRLLAYHAISQAGYMILGIGTCLPAGIAGGIFHMLNNAHYKSGLFFTAGSVEKQAGTADLTKLGGLAAKMPVTFVCFALMALSISGVPPFNGFFSKELVYDAAVESGWIFYLAAILGTFLTAVSFLKLGHCAYLGKPRADIAQVKEAPVAMLVPMCVIAVFCLVMGLGSKYLLNRWIVPVLTAEGEVHLPSANVVLILAVVLALTLAVVHHVLRFKTTKDALKVSDDIHYAPVLKSVYAMARKRYLDPYEWGMGIARAGSKGMSLIDRGINWVYDVVVPGAATAISAHISALHSGYYVTYIVWALVASCAVALFLLK